MNRMLLSDATSDLGEEVKISSRIINSSMRDLKILIELLSPKFRLRPSPF
jgi:hypothetical protein